MKPGAYVPLSVNYSEDDRVLDAGPIAELVWVRCLALAGRLWQQDGFLTARQLGRLVGDLDDLLAACVESTRTDPVDPIEDLVRVGLLQPDESDPHRPGYRLRSWSSWNRTAEEINARDQSKKAADAKRQADRRARLKAKKDVTDESQRDVTERPNVTVTPSRTSSTEAVQNQNQKQQQQQQPPPPLPELTPSQTENLATLAKAITKAGLSVSWKLDETELHRLLAALERCGIKALVDHAKRRHRADAPAFSVKAWLDGWEQLPALRLVNATTEPCTTHHTPDRDHCGGCAADRKAAQ